MLIMIHDGMGHRATGYALFQQKFWVPGASATGNKFVILAVDWLTRWAEGAATRDASPESAADFIYTHIVTRFGCPLSLQSDHGTHFVNPIIKALCRILRINHHLSTPYYPKSLCGRRVVIMKWFVEASFGDFPFFYFFYILLLLFIIRHLLHSCCSFLGLAIGLTCTRVLN